jgi:hypothetical protein
VDKATGGTRAELGESFEKVLLAAVAQNPEAEAYGVEVKCDKYPRSVDEYPKTRRPWN